MKSKSLIVARLNEIQARIANELKPLGFSTKGRTFRRETDAGVLQIVALQAGPFEIGPPPPESVSHLRPNLYGKFTVNLGVFVPEIHDRSNPPISLDRVISDAHCDIRTRLSRISEGTDLWWSLLESAIEDVDDIVALLLHVGLPFLDRFSSRELIVKHWVDFNDNELRLTNIARLDVAMILLAKGDREGARRLLWDHLQRTEAGKEQRHRNHARYVRELTARLGFGELG